MILAHGDNFFSLLSVGTIFFLKPLLDQFFFCPSPVFTVSQNIFQFCCFWITKFKFVIHLLNWAWGDTEAISYLVSQVCFQTCWKLPFRLRIRLLLIIVHARVWFLANFMNWNHQLHTGDRGGVSLFAAICLPPNLRSGLYHRELSLPCFCLSCCCCCCFVIFA